MYDIVIVGAGIAGSTLASLLDKKFKVLIIDKREILFNELGSELKIYSADDVFCGKCCGGLLSPSAQKAIASVGWALPKDVLVGPQVYGMKVLDIKSHVSRLYYRSYININRRKFDKWILDKALKKTEVIQNANYIRSEKVKDGYEVIYEVDGKEIPVRTRMIVGADGSQGKVRREFFREVPEPKKYAAIQEWYKCNYEESYYYSFADSAVSNYYSWIIPKENYIVLGSAIDDLACAKEKFKLLKEKLAKEGFAFKEEDLVRREGSVIYRPRSFNEIALVEDDVALIGEASGIISPSSSEGISYALRTGIILAEELNKDLVMGMKKYQARAMRLAYKAVGKKIRNPFLYNGFLRRIIMKSGIKSIKERW